MLKEMKKAISQMPTAKFTVMPTAGQIAQRKQNQVKMASGLKLPSKKYPQGGMAPKVAVKRVVGTKVTSKKGGSGMGKF